MKKHYICPSVTDFDVGAIAEIYRDFENRTCFEGRARLLEELDSNVDPTERYYVRYESKGSTKQTPHTITWSWKRWKITFIDGPNKGWTTARKIAYYVK